MYGVGADDEKLAETVDYEWKAVRELKISSDIFATSFTCKVTYLHHPKDYWINMLKTLPFGSFSDLERILSNISATW